VVRDLPQRGFRFVGPTICYAFMQAVGMVNDHTTDCFRYGEVRPLGSDYVGLPPDKADVLDAMRG
jgi:hypothetical protein